jgi:hypothetical protein
MLLILRGILICLFLLPSDAALGQVAFEGCVDFRGFPVASIQNPMVQDIAVATYAPNGQPVILYNPIALSWVSPATRIFFYAHECAHHVLGHGVQGHPPGQEQDADCWGIQELVSRGILNDAGVTAVQRDIARFGRGDPTHLPGPQRASNLRDYCLNN